MCFELPVEPYYKMEDLIAEKKDNKASRLLNMSSLVGRPNDLFSSQFASVMMNNIQESSRMTSP
jgi:hypothetical protein